VKSEEKIRLVIIVGPTASGKTELAVRLAERFDGEIVNADSMQVYRGMDIGTAKPSPELRQRVPHHLIDIVAPEVNFPPPISAGRRLLRSGTSIGAAGKSSSSAEPAFTSVPCSRDWSIRPAAMN
jgi:tRNA A37 N6-isopentenylltransferase MiaA